MGLFLVVYTEFGKLKTKLFFETCFVMAAGRAVVRREGQDVDAEVHSVTNLFTMRSEIDDFSAGR